MKYKFVFIITFMLLGLAVISCTESLTDNPEENQAPNTFLFIQADNASDLNQQKSRLQVHWWGDDPDGLVEGFFFKWEGLYDNWSFTTKNDSVFALPIGTVDTTFNFVVYAVDAGGNGKYDTDITQNGISFGAEPFTDENGDGVYTDGEDYIDIGLIDPTPAEQAFPIKNTAPKIEWSEASNLPAESLPVITVGWSADDLDGTESIVGINLALNDTTEFVTFERSVGLVTLRINDINAQNPEFEILLNGSESDVNDENLANLLLDDYNRLYVQAVDISGAKSAFIPLPDTSSNWYVRSPKGNLLIVDDFESGAAASDFYNTAFSTLDNGALSDKYNVLDVESTSLPYPNITFPETLKLFKYLYWYSDSDPSIDLLTLITQDYVESGGKIAFSLTLQDSSSSFEYDNATLQSFLPIEGFAQEKALNFLFPGATLLATDNAEGYDNLRTASTIAFVHTFVPSNVAVPLYSISSSQITGTIGMINSQKNLFLFGLPLHLCDGTEGTVNNLLKKVFIDEFGLSL